MNMNSKTAIDVPCPNCGNDSLEGEYRFSFSPSVISENGMAKFTAELGSVLNISSKSTAQVFCLQPAGCGWGTGGHSIINGGHRIEDYDSFVKWAESWDYSELTQ